MTDNGGREQRVVAKSTVQGHAHDSEYTQKNERPWNAEHYEEIRLGVVGGQQKRIEESALEEGKQRGSEDEISEKGVLVGSHPVSA